MAKKNYKENNPECVVCGNRTRTGNLVAPGKVMCTSCWLRRGNGIHGPVIIIAIDALEYTKVKEYECKNLMQTVFGTTNISEFTQPRTMVLWSSFMTGENKEREVIEDGNKEMWNKTWDIEDTLFSKFISPKVIDLPGYSYDLEEHKKSRELLKKFFNSPELQQKKIRAKYNKDAVAHHRKIKADFIEAVQSRDHDVVLGYFAVIDIIGHLNFGNRSMMKELYLEMDELCKDVKKWVPDALVLVMSDHGMKAIGPFGDHTDYGFWSTNWQSRLSTPTLEDIHNEIVSLKQGGTFTASALVKRCEMCGLVFDTGDIATGEDKKLIGNCHLCGCKTEDPELEKMEFLIPTYYSDGKCVYCQVGPTEHEEIVWVPFHRSCLEKRGCYSEQFKVKKVSE